MKILLLGKGVANNGCKRLLEKHGIEYEYLNPEEIVEAVYDCIVKSPGISLDDAIFLKVKGKIISDIELCYMLEHPFIIGVTGSNGKTTVVSMLGHILSSKFEVVVCGNIGYSVCDAVVDHPDCDIYIVELSSFQLEAVEVLDCNISVILNISLCHLDHHKNLNSYVDAKLNIAKTQGYSHYCVFNMDDVYLKDIPKLILSKPVGFSYRSTISRVYLLNDYIYFKNKRIYKLTRKDLTCKHRIENYLAVLTVVSLLNFNIKRAARLLKSFKDIRYRLTKIDSYVYNDAKSTNCASTMAAINSLNQIHLICGGYDRGMQIQLDVNALMRLTAVYSYGQTAQQVEEYFKEKSIDCWRFTTLEEAITAAYERRKGQEVILYSPMFASFDQYNSYEERGKEFDRIYHKLKHSKPIQIK